MAISINWGSLLGLSLQQEFYYLGSILGALVFLKLPQNGMPYPEALL